MVSRRRRRRSRRIEGRVQRDVRRKTRRESGPASLCAAQANYALPDLFLLIESAMFTAVENRGNQDNTPSAAIRAGLARLSSFLPKGWSVKPITKMPPQDQLVVPDAIWKLSGPDGSATTIVVEAKTRFEPRDVPAVAAQLDSMRRFGEPILIAPFMSGRSQLLLRERRISFMDGRGNICIELDRPAVLLRLQSDTKPTEPSKKPRRSLVGPITGRVVRFLCDFNPPFGVRMIARKTNVSAGGVSRILDFLDREKYITRDKTGIVESVDWPALLSRWAEDLAKKREQQLFFLPRGITELGARLAASRIRYSVSGSWASSLYALVAPPSEAFVYVLDIQAAAKVLDLRISERVTNVRLVEAFDRVVFDRTITRDGIITAAPTQILADLLTLPLRSVDEATEFESWMKRNEDVWRKS
uniref:HTH iclR-type domain-containing protein n=1 Tax=mine drainage metagenome TaxID=410659 RepID=E6Q0P4_9ZZZZ